MPELLTSPTLRISGQVAVTEAEGPGRRFALWLQGCPLRCPGCCNPEMLPFEGGQLVNLPELLREIDAAAGRHGVEGITLLGGEPTAQAAAAAQLAVGVQRMGLGVVVFSGFTLEELRQKRDPHMDDLLRHTDILVDGPYLRALPETRRRWIGSQNQVIHFLTGRYRADDPAWTRPNSLEIRFQGGELQVNGFPAAEARPLWRGFRPIAAWTGKE
jgi:anaerobic ribonucleoside-triphosphate reductase activating protein